MRNRILTRTRKRLTNNVADYNGVNRQVATELEEKNMKKIVALFVVIGALGVFAQRNIGQAVTIIEETTGTTNYVGISRTTQYTDGTPSTNDSVWRIIRTVTDGNNITVKNAYGDGEGDNALWSTAWTNRVNATYK